MSSTPDDERLLDILLSWEEARSQGRDLSAEELCAECPELVAELRQQINRLRALDAPLDTQDIPALSDTAGRAGAERSRPLVTENNNRPTSRCQRLRHHASGGLGDIFVGRDQELRREVALKELQSRLARDPDCRTRFLLEAEITGNLEHPGIVPVYGLGSYHDGRPYYAMRLIQGVSLKEAILRLHGDDGPDRARWALELRKLLGRFVAVCNAIAYAHGQGVIHRDIKPANVMLGDYGETLVVDWGLAKRLHVPVPTGASPDKLDGLAAPDEAYITGPGSVSGTPAYMSPEQARGETDRLGPASDVYSLGATLYSVLTGRAPFEDDNPRALLRRVAEGDFPPPRSTRAATPPALEAICLKAMSFRPEHRYDSALTLARDIESWLADEPVGAHREGWGERLARWSRRHRSWVRVGAVALLTISLASTVASVQIRQAWRRERDARRRAAIQRRTAEALAATSVMTHGLNLIKDGEINEGMIWLARSLKDAPPDAEDLQRVIRANLAAWRRFLPLKLLLGRPGQLAISAVRFRPDGRAILTGGHDTELDAGEYRLWDTASGHPVGPALRLRSGPQSMAFSPDGRAVFVGCGRPDRGIAIEARLWDVATGHPAGPDLPHPGLVFAAAFSPDGKILVTGCQDGKVRLWDVASGKMIGPPFAHPASVGAVAFSPDGRTLLTGCADGSARLWSIAAAKGLAGPMGHPTEVRAVAFSPDGRTLLTGCADGSARLWRTEGAQPLGIELKHPEVVNSVEFSPDGKLVATASSDHSAQLWEAASGARVGEPFRHESEVLSAAFSPDGRSILTTTWWDARLWRAEPDEPPAVAASHPWGWAGAAAFSPDGRTILAGFAHPITHRGEARLYEAATGKPLIEPIRHEHMILGVAFSPDGTRFLTGSGFVLGGPGEARLWEARTGRPVGDALKYPDVIYAVAFSPDGRMFLTGGRERKARIYVAATASVLRELPHPHWVMCAAFSPDGRTVVTGGGDGIVRLWDAETGRPAGPELTVGSMVVGVAFSPDGRVIATGSGNYTAQLWDARTGARIGPSFPHKKWVRPVAFSPDGRTLLTGSGDNTARLWDVATGRAIGPALRHQGWVTAGAFSPDGHHVVTASQDRSVRYWEVPGFLEGGAERIIRWTEILTGMEFDDGGTVKVLEAPDWQRRLQRLDELGGPPIVVDRLPLHR